MQHDQKYDKYNSPLSHKEIEKAIKSLNNKRACGHDGIPPEAMKATAPWNIDNIKTITDEIHRTGKMPEKWKKGRMTLIYKNKGKKDNLDNYRPLTLLTTIYKIWATAHANRLNEITHEITHESQNGFKAGVSTKDNIAITNKFIKEG